MTTTTHPEQSPADTPSRTVSGERRDTCSAHARPLPYSWEMQVQSPRYGGRKLGVLLTDANGVRIGWLSVTDDEPDYAMSEATAAYVVHACNAHHLLAGALKWLVEDVQSPAALDRAITAIQEAGEL